MPVGILKLPEGLINKAGFNPEQPRDDAGRWMDAGDVERVAALEATIRDLQPKLAEAKARHDAIPKAEKDAYFQISTKDQAAREATAYGKSSAAWSELVRQESDARSEIRHITHTRPARKAWEALPDNKLTLPEVSPKPEPIALLREIPADIDHSTVLSDYVRRFAGTKLSNEDKESVRQYVENGSTLLNNYLRLGIPTDPSEGYDLWEEEGKLDSVLSWATSVDKTFVPSDRPMILYRGVDLEFLDNFKNADQLVDRGYMSTSTSRDAARQFATRVSAEAGGDKYARDGVMIKVLLPKGSLYSVPSGLYPSLVNSSWIKSESEVILPRNTVLEPVRYVARPITTTSGKKITQHEFIVRAKVPTTFSKIPTFDHRKITYTPVAKAGFDPNQPRDEGGQWSESGGGSSGGGTEYGRTASQYKDWSRTDDVVNVLSSIAKSQKVKDAISKGIAAIVDQASGNLGGTENITNQYIDLSLIHI